MAKEIEKTDDEIINGLIHEYIVDWEEFYPDIKYHACYCENCRNQLEEFGTAAIDKLNIEKINHVAFRSKNASLKNVLTKRYVGKIKKDIFTHKNAQALIDFCSTLEALKQEHEDFKNIDINYLEFSQAIAETGDYDINKLWVETQEENAANIEMLFNTKEPSNMLFIARHAKLTKQQFEVCQDVIIASKDPQLLEILCEVEGANIERIRKVVIKTKDVNANNYMMKNLPTTNRQYNLHKKAIFESEDKIKFRFLANLFVESPSKFTEEEKNYIIKHVVSYRVVESAYILLHHNIGLSDHQIKVLQNVVLRGKNKSLIKALLKNTKSKEMKVKITERLEELNV